MPPNIDALELWRPQTSTPPNFNAPKTRRPQNATTPNHGNLKMQNPRNTTTLKCDHQIFQKEGPEKGKPWFLQFFSWATAEFTGTVTIFSCDSQLYKKMSMSVDLFTHWSIGTSIHWFILPRKEKMCKNENTSLKERIEHSEIFTRMASLVDRAFIEFPSGSRLWSTSPKRVYHISW